MSEMWLRMELTCISTFAGCGGSSLGYKWAGIKELLAIDFDNHAVEIFRLNFDTPIWNKDIREITVNEILEFCNIKKGDLDILDGSPPCQGFSTAGKRKVNDNRNQLYKEFMRLIDELQPKIFVMENVSGLVKGKMKGLFKEMIQDLKSLNYQVRCKLMNAKYYQVPQSRQRLIWIGVRDDIEMNPIFPIPSKKLITIKDALEEVPDDKKYFCKDEKLSLVRQMKPWNSGDDIIEGQSFNLKRLSWYKPSRTIIKQIGKPNSLYGGGLIHPDENRYLTIAELKRLQTFPDDFNIIGDFRKQWAVIGNSVPPKFMKSIARTIKDKILIPYYKDLTQKEVEKIER